MISPDRRWRMLSFRVRRHEEQRIRASAEQRGVSLSKHIRDAVLRDHVSPITPPNTTTFTVGCELEVTKDGRLIQHTIGWSDGAVR